VFRRQLTRNWGDLWKINKTEGWEPAHEGSLSCSTSGKQGGEQDFCLAKRRNPSICSITSHGTRIKLDWMLAKSSKS
jgi:hypothetical protein